MHRHNINRKCLILHDISYYNPWLVEHSRAILSNYEKGVLFCVKSVDLGVVSQYYADTLPFFHHSGSLGNLMKAFGRERFQPSDIYCHAFKPTVIGGILSSLFGNRLYVFQHFSPKLLEINNQLSFLHRKFRMKLLKYSFSKSERIFVFCQSVKEDLVNLNVAPSKISIIPIGIQEFREPLPDTKIRVSNNGVFRFVMVGRLVHEKNYHFALKILRHLKSKGIEFTLDIYGEGSSKESIMDSAAILGLEHVVEFKGFQSSVRFLLSDYDLLLHTSLTEGYGLVIVEALLEGIKVFSSEVGIARDLKMRLAPNLETFQLNETEEEICVKFMKLLFDNRESIKATREFLKTEGLGSALIQLNKLLKAESLNTNYKSD